MQWLEQLLQDVRVGTRTLVKNRTLLACAIPAMRMAFSDPAIALRQE
jgi:hypothetical protein